MSAAEAMVMGAEGSGELELSQVVSLFDLRNPVDRVALSNHIVRRSYLVEGTPIPMTMWVERNEAGELKSAHEIVVKDLVDPQLERLFLIHHPKLLFGYKMGDAGVLEQMARWKTKLVGQDSANFGVAYYYPGRRELIRGVGPELDAELLTSSNQDLITKEGQEKLSRFKVCFLGLSVGNSALRVWQQEGSPKSVIGADPDGLGTENLNRVMASRCEVGDNKALLAMAQALGHSPFTQTHLYSGGLALARESDGMDPVAKYMQGIIYSAEDISNMTEDWAQEILDRIAEIVVRPENFGQMFKGVNAIVEVMDNLRMKILTRLGARKLHIPVFLASDMDDTVLLDIERFDLEAKRPLFHGLISARELLALLAYPTPESFAEGAIKMLGADYMPNKFKQSLGKIGSTLVAPPQLGSTITIAAGIITKRLRELALGLGDQFSRKEYYDFAGFNFYIIPIVPKVHDI